MGVSKSENNIDMSVLEDCVRDTLGNTRTHYTCTCTFKHTDIRIHIHALTNGNTHAYTHTYTCTDNCTHMHRLKSEIINKRKYSHAELTQCILYT